MDGEYQENLAPKMSDEEVVDILVNMFGEVMDREVIVAIAESYGADLTRSTEALMQMSEDNETDSVVAKMEACSLSPNSLEFASALNRNINTSPSTTAAETKALSANGGAIQKVINNVKKPIKYDRCLPPAQIQRIVANHKKGYRTLIIMRGASGAGKSYTARLIVEATVGSSSKHKHIYCSDDFFQTPFGYKFVPEELGTAHDKNKIGACKALENGISPVIIDNTNTQLWEMDPYVRKGVLEGYYIELIEPKTTWFKNAAELQRRNAHNVPYTNIRRMLQRYEQLTDANEVISILKLTYPVDKVPPVMRLHPKIKTRSESLCDAIDRKSECLSEPDKNIPKEDPIQNNNNIENDTNKVNDILKEWALNDKWDDEISDKTESKDTQDNAPKPKRDTNNDLGLLDNWSLANYIKLCDVDATPAIRVVSPEAVVKKETKGTQVLFKESAPAMRVLIAKPRDINLNYIPKPDNGLPERVMLHKSTTTVDYFVTQQCRCENEEKHFIALRAMFKKIAREDLREIFDRCCGDVDWTVEIVLDSINSNYIEYHDEEFPDCEDIDQEPCNCIAAYNIIPDVNVAIEELESKRLTKKNAESATLQSTPVRKGKQKHLSEEQLSLKKQLEDSIVISNDYYSSKTFQMKNSRVGLPASSSSTNDYTCISPDNMKLTSDFLEPACASSSSTIDQSNDNTQEYLIASASSNYDESSQNDEDCSTSVFTDYASEEAARAEEEKTVVIGYEFVNQLDKIFGRGETKYPSEVMPMVTMPMSVLNKIDALWVESLTHQITSQQDCSELMIKEDEEYARKLAAEENLLIEEGMEPEVPDFKEIMDMDFALSIYKRDVEMWKTQEPDDWATRMSKDKLFQLFPDLQEESLSQILMSQDYNFQKTVELVLVTTGREDVVKEGRVQKFVVEKEMARQQRLLDEEMKKVKEKEYKITPFDEEFNKGDQKIDLDVVVEFRNKASACLSYRNDCLQKAQDCISRRMPSCANYYLQIAFMHRQRYEAHNNVAATMIMQFHTQNKRESTLDLHYFYVREAIEALDLFLDQNIQSKRENPLEPGAKYIITGRGAHSPAEPKIKPAVMKRLTARGIPFSPVNPGVVMVNLTGHEILTYQLNHYNGHRNFRY